MRPVICGRRHEFYGTGSRKQSPSRSRTDGAMTIRESPMTHEQDTLEWSVVRRDSYPKEHGIN